MQHDATEAKTLTHEEAMALLRPALPGELEEMRTRLRRALAGEDEELIGAAMESMVAALEDVSEFLDIEDDDAFAMAVRIHACLLFGNHIEWDVCAPRTQHMSEEVYDALPEGFSPLTQWGIEVSDDEVDKALFRYHEKYGEAWMEEREKIENICALFMAGYSGDDAAWLVGIER